MTAASPRMQAYFDKIGDSVKACYKIGNKARAQGFDPEDKVDIKLARNMAERVEGLIGVVAPQLMGSGMQERIMELEEEYSPLDWRVALKIAVEVAEEKFCVFPDKKTAYEMGIRTGFAYSTGGIVSAPLEGFIELRIKKTREGKEYFAPTYAGPIRGAGGTAAALSLLITDYVRVKMGFSKYDPNEEEIARYKTEIYDYHERITNLQYLPSTDELDFLLHHIPVEIDGEPTEKMEVSNHKDLPRVVTNRIRGGICLVLAEGLSQKAPKLWKRLEKWGKEFDLDWDFLGEFLKLQKQIKAKTKTDLEKGKLTPNYTFIKDLVAGRPVLTHPMAAGGFRLRYGRTRISGFSAAAINPSTMVLLKGYVATGTQLKVERPGKAAAITPCENIHGPIVLLNDGSVRHIESVEEAHKYLSDVKEILFLGDIVFNYGDFSENGHTLIPCGYNEEWWLLHVKKAMKEKFGKEDFVKGISELSSMLSVEESELRKIFDNVFISKPSFFLCKQISEKLGVPLHPRFTYYWKLISGKELLELFSWLEKMKLDKDELGRIKKIILPNSPEKRTLELVGVPHIMPTKENVVIEKEHAQSFLFCLNLKSYDEVPSALSLIDDKIDALENIQKVSPVKIMDLAGTFIGARMGRPEKAKMRKLKGSPQVLFPVGEEGGRMRSFQAALEIGKITADFPLYKCPSCKKELVFAVCPSCNVRSEKLYFCQCGKSTEKHCDLHGEKGTHSKMSISVSEHFYPVLKRLRMTAYPDLIKGVRGTSNKDHFPENLAKGILRAKHEVYVNKDGTIRFDMSELPLTHFTPKEISTDVEKLKELGYAEDINGNTLENADQIVEIMPQDVILPCSTDALDPQAGIVLTNVANFVDELLVKLYGLNPFYNVNSPKDLVGQLVLGLAPHISAGMVGRIIGFSHTQGLLTHPMFHASLRRDCDGDEASVSLLMDAVLNFSSQYLPDTRGAKTMDAPLVLTYFLNPNEIDDQAHGVDTAWNYPLELYESALDFKQPWDVKVEQIKDRLGKEGQYEKMGYTIPVGSINSGIVCSSYKALPSMEEKLKGQMEIAEQVRAVSSGDVARLVIEKHFIKDTKGNLRKFSQQQFRCVKCNAKYRRPPLIGKCTKCSGKIIFTISEGSVIKYLQPSISLAEKYNVPPYLKQSLQLLQMRVESVFGRDKEKQTGLGSWFG
jgi:DNA polymerase II large subunit